MTSDESLIRPNNGFVVDEYKDDPETVEVGDVVETGLFLSVAEETNKRRKTKTD